MSCAVQASVSPVYSRGSADFSFNFRLNAREVSVLDASWYMPSTGGLAVKGCQCFRGNCGVHKQTDCKVTCRADRDAKREFCEERIPGSRFFDIDRICDVKSQLPHMLPSEKSFAAAADALGVDNTSSVIIYDRSGIFSAPRVWWTFRTFGHRRCVKHAMNAATMMSTPSSDPCPSKLALTEMLHAG